jgi:hypothetical protein
MRDYLMSRDGPNAMPQVTNSRSVRLIEHRFAATTVTNRGTLTHMPVRLPTQID